MRFKMKLHLVVVGMLLVVTSCAVGIWSAIAPPLTPLLVPGASDIQVVNIGLGEWEIAYATPGPPYAWYFAVARTLEAQHWILRNPWRPDLAAPMFDPIVPLRFEVEYGGLLWDEAVLYPDHQDPNRARIQVRRQIVLPRWYSQPSIHGTDFVAMSASDKIWVWRSHSG